MGKKVSETLAKTTALLAVDTKDFTIGKLTQQNEDLVKLITTMKENIDELILRKDKSCFMCRESLKLTKRNCESELEAAKNNYEDRLNDLGELLNQKNLKQKSGKHFIICERSEY